MHYWGEVNVVRGRYWLVGVLVGGVVLGMVCCWDSEGGMEVDLGDGFVMVYVAEGEFVMGAEEYDERPVRRVFVDGFWIGKMEVTVGQYRVFAKETGGYFPEWLTVGDDHPAYGMPWGDAVAFCEWLGRKKGVKVGLPTEAQWEKAARGSDGRMYPWGNSGVTGELANVADVRCAREFPGFEWADRSIDDGYVYTAPVGSFPAGASPWGALDMAGNVWEFCREREGTGIVRVRGGSCLNGVDECRCSYRLAYERSRRDGIVGFRIVVSR